jgi:adenylosuccinate synthase
MVVLRGAVRLNGLTGLAVTKVDVLTGTDPVRICTAYKIRGKVTDRVPADQGGLSACEPVYESLPGWKEDITHCRRQEDLPANAKRFLARMEELAKVPVQIISVGPGREETIMVSDPFIEKSDS